MYYLSLLLHIYQPPTQDLEITKKITEDSYRLILKILNKTRGKITLNIPGSLSEQLIENHDEDVIRGICDLKIKNQLEFTQTAMYHPILPRLLSSEIRRQIALNNETNRRIFGEKIYCPEGFFPPEMAYSSHVDKVLRSLNYKWVMMDELGYKRHVGTMSHHDIYIKKHKNNINNNISYYFRDDRLSNAVALSQVKTLGEFDRLLHGFHYGSDSYAIMALDGETFGHHQVGQDKLLADILSYNKYKIVLISEIEKYIRNKVQIRPLISSWGSIDNDLRKKVYWTKWSYPGNVIQQLQWRLLNLAVESSQNTKSQKQRRARVLLDKGLHSDQFWWSSHRPYWHPEMVRKGAKLLLDSVLENQHINMIIKKEAESIYNEIVEKVAKVGEEIVVY